MARYSYGSKKKYKLSTKEPRGDAPGGVYPKGSDAYGATRDDDIRFASRYNANMRKPAPHGRYPDGSPRPRPVKNRRSTGDNWIG